MNIDLVVISLQAIFISLYGVIGTIQPKSYGKRRWAMVLLTYLALTTLYFFFQHYIKENIHLILFFLLFLDYLFQSFFLSMKWMRVLLVSTLAFLSYGLLYFQVQIMLLWLVAPLVFGISFLLIKRYEDWFMNAQTYFLSAGTLLTILFMLEPVFVSVQQNLKPIPTIPISSIINQQNFLLLGVLLVLALGGFFWKEKSRL